MGNEERARLCRWHVGPQHSVERPPLPCVQELPRKRITCEVRQGCGSSKAAASTMKACLYGIEEASECPVDMLATSGATSKSGAILIAAISALLGVAIATVR